MRVVDLVGTTTSFVRPIANNNCTEHSFAFTSILDIYVLPHIQLRTVLCLDISIISYDGRVKVTSSGKRCFHQHVLIPFHRQELLAWANSLLQLNLTKVEQFGTGYEKL